MYRFVKHQIDVPVVDSLEVERARREALMKQFAGRLPVLAGRLGLQAPITALEADLSRLLHTFRFTKPVDSRVFASGKRAHSNYFDVCLLVLLAVLHDRHINTIIKKTKKKTTTNESEPPMDFASVVPLHEVLRSCGLMMDEWTILLDAFAPKP